MIFVDLRTVEQITVLKLSLLLLVSFHGISACILISQYKGTHRGLYSEGLSQIGGRLDE
jgi:hypothetical protein